MNAVATIAGSLALIAVLIAPAGAQPYDPLAEGFRLHVQAGFAWATLRDAEPAPEDVSYARRRVPQYSLRVSRLLAGPVSGYAEGAIAQRGAEIRQTGQPTVLLRSRYYDAGLGVNIAARCMWQLCPSLDVGALLGYHRESVLQDAQTGQLVSSVDAKPTETAAVFGVRVASARFRGIAAVLRHHEGLTDLPEEGLGIRNRAITLLISLPLGR